MIFIFRGRRSLTPMRVLWIFCIVCTTPVFAQTFTIPKKQATLEKIFSAINVQTGYFFSASDKDTLFKRSVPAAFKDFPLQVFLDERLPSYGLTYSISPDNPKIIILRAKEGESSPDTPVRKILHRIEGIVVRGKSDLLRGITVQIKGTDRITQSDEYGGFFFTLVPANVIIRLTGVNVDTVETSVTDTQIMIIHMKDRVTDLEEKVIISNGYETILKDSTTGSYKVIPRSLLERSVTTNVLDRIENLTSGLLVNHGSQTSDGSSLPNTRVIRGPSTLYADDNPLLIVDNFPYEGNISNINPNDIENLTILKDASATAIWGVRAANGVIVITTKKGKASHPQLVINSSLSFRPRPEIFNVRSTSSTEYIDLEKNLYKQGYYTPNFNNNLNYAPVTPVVWLLHAVDQGMISPQKANARIQAMKNHDIRNDIQKYLYGNGLDQQYSAQLSGQTSRLNYFASAGLDHNAANLRGVQYIRLTGRVQGTYTVNNRLQLSTGMNYTNTLNENGNNPGYNYLSYRGGKNLYPYAQLVNEQGHSLSVFADYNPDYLRKTASMGFLNGAYYPIQDIGEEKNKAITRDYLFNFGLRDEISSRLHLDIKYQLEQQTMSGNDFHSDSSYFVRDLINTYTQVDPTTGRLSYPVPWGGISDLSHQGLTSHQGRVQLSYHKNWNDIHDLSILGATEIRSLVTTSSSNRQYGVGNAAAPATINDSILYPSYMVGEPKSIPSISGHSKKTDHFLSGLINGAYTYRNRYTFSASLREDAANLFGAATNTKVVPLWSVGSAWHLSREDFFSADWLSLLTFRGSIGTSGNISRLATAYTTASTRPGGITGTTYLTASIQSPANADLRWEVVKVSNMAIDFATKNNNLTGTMEYYFKTSTGLMAQTFEDPTLGGIQNPGSRAYYYSNTAAMTGKGIDLELNSHNLSGELQWTTNYIFSFSSSRVTSFSPPKGIGKTYLASNFANPSLGKPLYAVYSYKWLGLDSLTGDPVGSYNGKPSMDWASIYNNTSLDSMVYKGPAQPTIFGAWLNTFTMGSFSFSFNISYKFNYYFRKPALSYNDLFTKWNSLGSYSNRWQKSGDEKHTNVPSINYSAGTARDLFYANATVMAARADNIRLEDINISYDKDNFHWGNFRCQHLKLFTYVSNLWLLWKANKDSIDPYYVNVPKDGKRYSIGLSVSLK